MDPGTAILVASAIASAANIGGQAMSSKKQEKAAKYRAKEMERETKAGLFQDALQRSAELEAHRLTGRSKLGKRKSQSFQDTADLVRGAFNI